MKILEDIYKESATTIKLHKVNIKIPIQKGVRQGKVRHDFSGTVRSSFRGSFKKLEWEESGIQISGEYLNEF